MGAWHLKASYFAIANPLDWVDRRLHRRRYRRRVMLGGAPLDLSWTARAERALERADEPLVIEMQLYFSCVVQKRVLFQPLSEFRARAPETPAIEADSRLLVCFRSIAAAACDPLEFAAHHPEGRALDGAAAARMLPRTLQLDYRNGAWEGHFEYM